VQLTISTWNINSVRLRIRLATRLLRDEDPDVLCLQEIKCVDEAFPREAVEAAGYNVASHGQKTFNGVAILSKRPIEDVRRGLPGDPDDTQARYLEAVIPASSGVVRVASIYLPNGNPLGTPKFDYKLTWMDRLKAHVRDLLVLEEPLVLAGDYNVIPEPRDARRPEAWVNDALFRPESRALFHELLHLGFSDAVRTCDDRPGLYTFWDYQAGSWQKDDGIRIDHVLLSPQAVDRLAGIAVHKHTRSWEKPSDHVPVLVELTG
jgi:exodeoxyribonuclease-3